MEASPASRPTYSWRGGRRCRRTRGAGVLKRNVGETDVLPRANCPWRPDSPMGSEKDSARVHARLTIKNGEFEGMSYELSTDETLIGRNPTTDITLLDEGISREHSLILYDENTRTYTIEDLQSTNGTKVNGKRVRSTTLRDGDDVHIGHTHFQFLLSD